MIKVMVDKLSNEQIDALQLIMEEKSLMKTGCRIHNNLMNSLYFKGMIRLPRYANGEFWEITDKGIETLKKNNEK